MMVLVVNGTVSGALLGILGSTPERGRNPGGRREDLSRLLRPGRAKPKTGLRAPPCPSPPSVQSNYTVFKVSMLGIVTMVLGRYLIVVYLDPLGSCSWKASSLLTYSHDYFGSSMGYFAEGRRWAVGPRRNADCHRGLLSAL